MWAHSSNTDLPQGYLDCSPLQNCHPPFLFFLHRCWRLSKGRPRSRSSLSSSFPRFWTTYRDASLTSSSSCTGVYGFSPLLWSFDPKILRRSQSCFIPQVHNHLRGMCVLFAGPFPAGFSERNVKRLFGRCGPVRKIQMLNTSVRVCDTHVCWRSVQFSIMW